MPATHALLVGVSNYPHLNERYHLKGPANDMLLMHDLLSKQFAFPKDNITILSEAEGKKDAKNYPNRACIQREFERLARIAQPGDQIVIMMGGHGSQQPEPENPADPEPDGLDEIFLPRDVKEWEGDAGKVPNAIIDDELGAWLKAIQAKKAFVWIIFDSCHSGTMIRGIKEQERQCNAQTDLKIPAEAIRKAEMRAAKRAKEGTRGGPAGPERNPLPQGGIVAIYACQSNEVTVERELPPQSKDAKPYGLLTYTLVQILTQAQQNSGKPPTYRELVQMLNSRYAGMGRNAPTPQIEGGHDDRTREVLSTTAWPGRSSILLTQETKGWKINAGLLHGITSGTVLAVRRLADEKNADDIVGHVRVEEAKMTSAMVVPCAFEDKKLEKALPEEARCDAVHVHFGVEKLRVALDPLHDKNPLDKDEAGRIGKSIDDAIAKGNTMLQRVDAIDKADWIVRRGKGGIYLLPVTEYVRDDAAKKETTSFGPYALGTELSDKLHDRFTRIARAANFKKLVSTSEGETPRGKTEGGVQVDLKLVRYANAKDRKGVPVPIDAGKVKLFHADTIGMTVHNPNRFAIDVTMLYIDSGYGIDAYFPDPGRGEINRIKSGETITIPTIVCDGSETFGLENLIVIAIKASGKEPISFSFMAQPTLEKAIATRGKLLGNAPKSPLESLLETSVYGEGTTRGISRRAVEDFAFRVVPWQLSHEVRPKDSKD